MNNFPGITETVQPMQIGYACLPINIRNKDYSLSADSPLGRGFLAGKYKSIEDMPPNDWRRATNPRFSEAHFDKVCQALNPES